MEGGAHGIARLHSLYDLDGGRMVREGVVAAEIKNGIKATSEPSVRNLAAWDLELISRTAAANGLWNTAVDFYDFTVKKYRDEERLEEATFEMFLEKNLNITSVEKERRESIIFHDQTLVRTIASVMSWCFSLSGNYPHSFIMISLRHPTVFQQFFISASIMVHDGIHTLSLFDTNITEVHHILRADYQMANLPHSSKFSQEVYPNIPFLESSTCLLVARMLQTRWLLKSDA